MRKLITAAVLTLTLLACGDSTGPMEHTGDYNLVSVNGESVPLYLGEYQALYEGEVQWFSVELFEGRITLQSGGLFTDRLTFRLTGEFATFDDPEVTEGSYSVSGGTITFTSSAEVLVGRLSGGRITIEGFGNVFVYQRQ